MDGADFLVFGVSAVALVMALVQMLKGAGLSARWAPLASIGLGLLLSGGNALAQILPWFGQAWQVAIMGLVVGLAASGVYSGTKALRGK